MFEHDYDKKPFELYSLKEQLERAGLLEEELEKLEKERPSLEELIQKIAKNKEGESTYWRFKEGGLNYFNKHINIYKWLSRKQLKKIDGGLYYRLRSDGDLENAISYTVRRDFSIIDPVAYFYRFHAEECTSLVLLFRKDQSLYNVLQKIGKLYDIFEKNYRSYEKNPLKFFNEHPEYQGLSRTQLNKVDRKLYRALHYYNQMDQAIPEKKSN